jgi:hypothetical protein
MAKADPAAGIHKGTVGGSVKAKIKPVTAALPSPIVIGRFIKARVNASVKTAVPIETKMISNACHPK